ncbi:MAG: DnaD domain protein [Anaerolineae bacterium]|nr:DnaD domain protein [Anaerolineae bacterium]
MREHAGKRRQCIVVVASSSLPLSALESSSSQPPVLETWEDLEGEYGVDLVRQAVEAAPDDKRNSPKYVAGILKNWRRRGDQRRNRRKRSDPFAHDAGRQAAPRRCAPDGAGLLLRPIRPRPHRLPRPLPGRSWSSRSPRSAEAGGFQLEE